MGLISKAIVGAVASLVLYQILHCILYDAFVTWRFAPSRENTAGKRILVTGSSKGVGRGLIELYSELGAHVTVHGRSLDALTEVSSNCRKIGAASVHTVVGDMSKVGEAEKIVRSAAEAMGGLDIVIVNHISPYVFETLHSAVSRIRSGQLQRDLQVDLFSYAEAALAAVPLLERSSGSIVFVSSVVSRRPALYFYEYGFAKRSLEGFVASLRQELAINGSSVHTGFAVLGAIDTESARNVMPKAFHGDIQYASLRSTASDIGSVAVGHLREIVSPGLMKPFMLLSELLPDWFERVVRDSTRKL